MKPTAQQIAALDKATEMAREVIKPGDKISRRMCGGAKGTFTFIGWDGRWLQGKTVTDCHAAHIYKVNGVELDFYKQSGGL